MQSRVIKEQVGVRHWIQIQVIMELLEIETKGRGWGTLFKGVQFCTQGSSLTILVGEYTLQPLVYRTSFYCMIKGNTSWNWFRVCLDSLKLKQKDFSRISVLSWNKPTPLVLFCSCNEACLVGPWHAPSSRTVPWGWCLSPSGERTPFRCPCSLCVVSS